MELEIWLENFAENYCLPENTCLALLEEAIEDLEISFRAYLEREISKNAFGQNVRDISVTMCLHEMLILIDEKCDFDIMSLQCILCNYRRVLSSEVELSAS